MTALLQMVHSLREQLTESTQLSANYEAKVNLLMRKQKQELHQERTTCEAAVLGLEDQLQKKKSEVSKLHAEMKEQQVQLQTVMHKNIITEQYAEDSSLIKKLQKLLAEANEKIHSLTIEQQSLTSQGSMVHQSTFYLFTFVCSMQLRSFDMLSWTQTRSVGTHSF